MMKKSLLPDFHIFFPVSWGVIDIEHCMSFKVHNKNDLQYVYTVKWLPQ